MSLPTLLKTGSILPQKWMTKDQKHKLETLPAMNWILEYLTDRAWQKSKPPKIKIKGPGSRVGLFRSGTGTGKSTVMPTSIYLHFKKNYGINKNLICTQPTIATATSIPYDILHYNIDFRMGENIGYQTGALVRKPVKGVLFATIGILLQHLKLLTDKQFMRKYSFIIIDEIHNRSVETDICLFYLRRFLERNYDDPECPFLILTSGTFEPEIYMDYFGCPSDAFLDITGSSFPIESHFSKFDISNYMQYTVDLAEKIHVENISDITSNQQIRDVLIFTQGGGQIKEITKQLHLLNARVFSKGIEYSKKHSDEQQKKYGGKTTTAEYYVCPVSVSSENIEKGGEDYKNLFSHIDTITIPIYKIDSSGELTDQVIKRVPASRRIIIATNAIETGITIETLKYCIDTGYVNEAQFNPNYGAKTLINKSVTKSSAIQRKGRVGRKEPGVFYACYTQETFDRLPPLPFPEIIKADVTEALLSAIVSETDTELIEIPIEDLKKHPNAFQMNKFDQRWYSLTYKKPFDMSSLLFLQSPAADSYRYSLEKLRVLGLIDHQSNLTILGWYASKFRKIQIEDARMILAGYHHGANVLDLITIASFLQIGYKLGIKRRKYKPRNILGLSEAENELYYNVLFGDELIEYLFIWNDLMEYVEDLVDILHKSYTGVKRTRKVEKVEKDVFEGMGENHRTSELTTESIIGGKQLDLNLVKKIYEWSEKNNFNPGAIMKVIQARDELITDFLSLGMNPFYNGLNLPRGEYNLSDLLRKDLPGNIEEIKKIKKCIYEGNRLNLYLYNDISKSYVSSVSHNSIIVDSKLLKGLYGLDQTAQNKPQKIIVRNVDLRQSQVNPGMYDFNGSDISILDGFLEPDLQFLYS